MLHGMHGDYGKKLSSGKASYAKGGTTKMFPYTGSKPQAPGTSSPGGSGGKMKFAEGGKTGMFGYSGSQPQAPGTSSPGSSGKMGKMDY